MYVHTCDRGDLGCTGMMDGTKRPGSEEGAGEEVREEKRVGERGGGAREGDHRQFMMTNGKRVDSVCGCR